MGRVLPPACQGKVFWSLSASGAWHWRGVFHEGLDEELDEGLDEKLDDELDEDVRDARLAAKRRCSVAVGQLAVLDKVVGLMKKQVAGG